MSHGFVVGPYGYGEASSLLLPVLEIILPVTEMVNLEEMVTVPRVHAH